MVDLVKNVQWIRLFIKYRYIKSKNNDCFSCTEHLLHAKFTTTWKHYDNSFRTYHMIKSYLTYVGVNDVHICLLCGSEELALQISIVQTIRWSNIVQLPAMIMYYLYIHSITVQEESSLRVCSGVLVKVELEPAKETCRF